MVVNWTKSIHEEEGLLHLSDLPLTHALSFAFKWALPEPLLGEFAGGGDKSCDQ